MIGLLKKKMKNPQCITYFIAVACNKMIQIVLPFNYELANPLQPLCRSSFCCTSQQLVILRYKNELPQLPRLETLPRNMSFFYSAKVKKLLGSSMQLTNPLHGYQNEAGMHYLATLTPDEVQWFSGQQPPLCLPLEQHHTCYNTICL